LIVLKQFSSNNKKDDHFYGVVANVLIDDILRPNAKVVILHTTGTADVFFVRGRAKGGRPKEKYISPKSTVFKKE